MLSITPKRRDRPVTVLVSKVEHLLVQERVSIIQKREELYCIYESKLCKLWAKYQSGIPGWQTLVIEDQYNMDLAVKMSEKTVVDSSK